MKLRLLLPVLLAMACGACVTHIRPTVTGNPPPTEAFAGYQHFLLEPMQVAPEAAGQTKAIAKINLYMNERIATMLAGWENRNRSGRTLSVEPRIVQLKFVSGAKRFWAGDFAGSSAVLMRVKFVDAATGKVIADPEFFQRAAAEGGTWSFGGTDNGMLSRIVTVIHEYLARNYARPVGGPTGLVHGASR